MTKRPAAACFAAAVLSSAVSAQPSSPPALVRDFTTVPTADSSSGPFRFTPVGERVVFLASGGVGQGLDLWGSDGAASSRLIDVVPQFAVGLALPIFATFNMTGSGGGEGGERLLFTRLFSSLQGGFATELWITDGTPAGTVRLLDREFPGLGGSLSIHWMTDVGGGLALIRARTPAQGYELWRTDGTPAGSGPVREFSPGPGNSDFSRFTRAGSALFFVPYLGPAADSELWVTDGAIASTQTRLVRNIQPGDTPSNPQVLGALGGSVLFSANGPGTGNELWRSNGTESGTVLVRDINPGVPGAGPWLLALLGDRTVFSASEPTRGLEPWISDGTAQGTAPLADINPGPADSSPFVVARSGSIVYFTANQAATGTEIWRTDGTTGGTRLLADLSTGPATNSTGVNTANVLADGRVLFLLYRRSSAGGVRALYITDLAGDALSLVAEFPNAYDVSVPAQSELNGRVVFFYRPFGFGAPEAQLWSTDLTPQGTRAEWTVPVATEASTCAFSMRVLEDTAPGGIDRAVFVGQTSSPGARRMFVTDGTQAGSGEILVAGAPAAAAMTASEDFPVLAGGRVYFAAADHRGVEPWVSGGQLSGADSGMLVNIRPDATRGTWFGPTAALGNRLVFAAAQEQTSGARPLRITDGSDAGTSELGANVEPESVSIPLANGRIAFASRSQIVVTDGTPAGTGPLFPSAQDSPSINGIAAGPVLGGRIVFHALDPLDRSDLWISDGTAAGTSPIDNIQVIGDLTFLYDLTAVGPDRVYFVHGGSTLAIMSTDGVAIMQHTNTAGGPTTLRPHSLTPFGGKLAFIDDAAPAGEELRVFDPADGSVVTFDIATGSLSSFPLIRGDFGGRLVFEATDISLETRVYITDGTLAGTVIADPDPSPARANPRPVIGWNGRIIFHAEVPGVGSEAFALDPASAHWTLLGETLTGDDPSIPFTPIAALGSRLLGYGGAEGSGGSAPNGHGEELWITDGTTLGTRLLADLRPGPESSRPRMIAADGLSRVYFTADAGPADGGPGVYSTDGATVTRLSRSDALMLFDQPFPRAGMTVLFPGSDPLRGVELWSWHPPACLADFNRDGTVTVQDIFDFLTAYFTSTPTADLDGSGQVTVQDVFDFIAAYFTPCA